MLQEVSPLPRWKEEKTKSHERNTARCGAMSMHTGSDVPISFSHYLDKYGYVQNVRIKISSQMLIYLLFVYYLSSS